MDAAQTEKTIPVSAGIVLLSFGKRGYKFAAANLAVSIKHFNRNVQICVFTDSADDLQKQVGYRTQFFDHIIEDQTLSRIDPGYQKLRLYELIEKGPFDHNIYVDVDSIALKDISPLIDTLVQGQSEYLTLIHAQHTKKDGPKFADMVWGTPDRVWDHFELTETSVFPSTNSSFQYIRKGEKAKAIFDKAREFYEKPFPLLGREQWGGTQPDELYLNASLAFHNIIPGFNGAMYVPGKKIVPPFEIAQENYFMTFFGPRHHIPAHYRNFYDDSLFNIYKALGIGHTLKMEEIYKTKHVH